MPNALKSWRRLLRRELIDISFWYACSEPKHTYQSSSEGGISGCVVASRSSHRSIVDHIASANLRVIQRPLVFARSTNPSVKKHLWVRSLASRSQEGLVREGPCAGDFLEILAQMPCREWQTRRSRPTPRNSILRSFLVRSLLRNRRLSSALHASETPKRQY